METAKIEGLTFKNVYAGEFVDDSSGEVKNYYHINFLGRYTDPKLTISKRIINQVEEDFSEGDIVTVECELSYNRNNGRFGLGEVIGVVAE